MKRLKLVVTVQAAQAGLKRQLQSSVDRAEAVDLESKTLAAQMVAQVEAHKQELSLMEVRLSVHHCTCCNVPLAPFSSSWVQDVVTTLSAGPGDRVAETHDTPSQAAGDLWKAFAVLKLS